MELPVAAGRACAPVAGAGRLPPAVDAGVRADVELVARSSAPAVLAHGDFTPRNVICAPGGRARSPIDLEFARMADSRFDAAWWAVITALDSPQTLATAWPVLARAAAWNPEDLMIGALGRQRVLEVYDHTRRRDAAGAGMWHDHLVALATP